MTITAAFVLFAVLWFMIFLMVLPLRLVTQGDAGEVTPGTHASAPTNPDIGPKAKITTFWAMLLWCLFALVITSGAISVRDFDMRHVMPSPAAGD